MQTWQVFEADYPELRQSLDVLKQRGITIKPEPASVALLTRELTPLGWSWQFENNGVTAKKAFTPSGTVSQTFGVEGPDRLPTLAIVLAQAMSFDEGGRLSLVTRLDADLSISTSDGRVIALAEVQNIKGMTADDAAETRRNLILHTSWMYAQAPFFMFFTQDNGFLWDQRSGRLPLSPPTKVFPMNLILDHYIKHIDTQRRLSGREIEVAIARWFTDLAEHRDERPTAAVHYFDDTEFLDAISGACVDYGVLI